MPNVAALIDEIRETFPGAKLIYGQDLETGVAVGKPPIEDPDKVFRIPENYYPTRTTEEILQRGRKRGK
jgi:hypothetical protein